MRRIFSLALLILLAACSAGATELPTPTLTPAFSPTPSQVPTPTSTPEPMAVEVNGEGISLAEYQAELQRLQAAQAAEGQTNTPEEQRQMVLDSLINQTLLAQAAYQDGFTLDDAGLQARIDALANEIGGQSALTDWQSANFYTDASFRVSLRRSLAAAWQRDRLAAATPTTAEQVHARQLLFFREADAQAVYQEIAAQNGANFEDELDYYDPLTKGELGWFPRGYLLQPEVEEAAFALQPGQFSSVIHSQIGYHIIQVVERETNHELSPDALHLYQENAIRDWLTQHKAESQINILVP